MASHSSFSRLGALLGVASLAAAPLLGSAPAASAEPAPPAPLQKATGPAVATTGGITWKRCGGMQCGELEVPLDYSDPAKGTTTLFIGRRPADRPEQKKGVLFVNPGGPGGSAAASVPSFAQLLGRDIRRQFDIVGVEPRGVGGSDLAICEGEKGEEPVMTEQMFPWKDDQYEQFLKKDEYLRQLCLRSKPKILPHMTTADVARDMDRVREVLGQKQISYYGVSYGSFLGATYANLFPSRVRSMVVDGVIDPVAWSTGRGDEAKTVPTTTRLRSDIGAHEGLMAAIAECENVGERYCQEHADIREDWAALTTRLRNESVVLGEGENSFPITYDFIVAMTLSSLYDPEAIPDLLAFIHEFRQVVDNPAATPNKPTAKLERTYRKVVDRDRENREKRIAYDPPVPEEPEWVFQWMPTFEGVVCSETRNPQDPRAWIAAGKMADRRAPGFGPLWTWASSVCGGVPNAPSAYYGPYTTKPAGGIMVMSTKHDPATPYSGAQAMHALSPGSRMITVDGWGHATLDMSGCATKARNSYLISGKLPAKNRVCKPDHGLFTALD